MIKASIVSIGNEILNGQTVDTNAAYLSKKLLSIGIAVVTSYTVGDQIDSIVRALQRAAGDADVILVTGGLGPTDDDLTRQGVAKFLGVELQLEKQLLEMINNYFTRRNLRMPEKNKVQAYMPVGTRALANNLGTAPGIAASVNNKKLFAMPGVPSEMKAMFEESLVGELKKLAPDQAVTVLKLKCFGTGESNIAESLGSLMQRDRNPLINCTAEYGVITLHIIATAKDKDQARQMAEKDKKSLTELLGDLIYGTDDQTLAQVVGQRLAQNNETIAVAESCTGGTLAKLFTDVPGASRYFTHGWVTYTNKAKVNELGVSQGLIEKHGAVSEQVAEAMAEAAKKKAKASFAIGITGIAGPGGGSEQKPVGLTYISIACETENETRRFIFSHDRDFIRQQAAQTALNMLRLKLQI